MEEGESLHETISHPHLKSRDSRVLWEHRERTPQPEVGEGRYSLGKESFTLCKDEPELLSGDTGKALSPEGWHRHVRA